MRRILRQIKQTLLPAAGETSLVRRASTDASSNSMAGDRLVKYEKALNRAYFNWNLGYFYRQMSFRFYFQQAEYARLNARNTAWSWRNHVLLEYLGEDVTTTITPKDGEVSARKGDFYDEHHLLPPNGPAMPMSLRGAVIDDEIVEGVTAELGRDRSLENKDLYQFIPEKYSIQQATIDYSYLVDQCDCQILSALRRQGIDAGTIGVFSIKSPVYETILFMVNPTSKLSYIGPLQNAYDVKGMRLDNAEDTETFDLVLCDTAISNYGFGRYHEQEDQENGDLRLFRALSQKLNPGGLMLVILPVCEDYLVRNIGRFYGSARLQKVFEGFDVVYQYDLTQRDFFETSFQMKEVLFCLARRGEKHEMTADTETWQ